MSLEDYTPKQRGQMAAIKRWADQGFCGRSVAMVMDLSYPTVKTLAVVVGATFGCRRYKPSWERFLAKQGKLPENLAGQHELFLRHMDSSPDWTIGQLGNMLLVSEQTVTDWWVTWNKRRVIRRKLAAADYKLWKTGKI